MGATLTNIQPHTDPQVKKLKLPSGTIQQLAESSFNVNSIANNFFFLNKLNRTNQK